MILRTFVELNESNFKDVTTYSGKPTLVLFCASWSGPCRMLNPILNEIAENRGDVVIGKLDVEESTKISDEYDVKTVPTMIIFKKGKPILTWLGVLNKEQLNHWLDSSLKQF